jgi:peptidyl-prolyl cis-trans isomerase C
MAEARTGAAMNIDLPRVQAARSPVAVNGVIIPRVAIAREAQHHPAQTPAASMRAATEALVIRELLLQEARRQAVVPAPQCDDRGRRETAEEAMIRAVVEHEVAVPTPTETEVVRYYDANRSRFRTPDLYEARHILIAALHSDATASAAAKAQADAIATEAAAHPDRFADLAKAWSSCASAADGGHLGQITAEETTPDFAAALGGLGEGETTGKPVVTRYGFHIIRLERRFPGQVLPLAAVTDRIAAYLVERSRRLASAQFIARLVSAAEITGTEIAGADALRVH